MSFHHWLLAGLSHLNPGKICIPILVSYEEYGNTAQQKHFQPFGH
uniref:Ras GTPase-activating protein-binding protein 1 isoform X2 n=1 Tax=Rhizophora mucronata TaxID=61149 RepID=A0A2P2K6V5_RHIMU